MADHDGRGVEGADLCRVGAGRDALRGVGGELGVGREVAGDQQGVALPDLHDEVVDRCAGGERVDGAREVVGELEGVLGAALGRGDRAGEDVVVGEVLRLVVAGKDVAGDPVDERGEGDAAAGGDVDDVGLEDRAHGAVGHRQGAQAHLLLLGEAGHDEAGPAGADRAFDVRDLERGDADR